MTVRDGKRHLAVGTLLAGIAVALTAVASDASWWCVPAALLGWYLADAASGIVHMIMDYRPCPAGSGLARLYFYEGSREDDAYLRLLRETMARVSPLDRLTYDFKNHHPRPDALGRRSLWRQIGSTVLLAALPAVVALDVAWWFAGLPGWAMAAGCSFIVGGALSQYFHGTLHRADNPWFVTVLRKVGLLMTPSAHRRHHDTLQRDFSTNCGWSNPLLNIVFDAARQRGHFRDAGLEPVN